MKHPFDFPVPGQPSPAGGQGTATESFPAEASSSPSHHHEPSHFRLAETDRHGRTIELPVIYTNVDDAVVTAHWLIDQLAAHPHRRPQLVRVFDVWTGEVMARVRPDDDYDETICPTCGQNRDPF